MRKDRTKATGTAKKAWTPPPTPYGGLVAHKTAGGAAQLTPAQTAPHLLVSGPTGVGKSRRVLGPGILMWGGPVVAVSSKPDLIELCLAGRHERPGARTYVLDLSGEVPDDDLPADVQKVVVDPVALITCDDDAIDLATILMQSGAAGAGGGTGGKSGDAFWENISTAPLAALLRAAGADGIAWAREAVSRVEPADPEDTEQPSWLNAVGRLESGSPMLAAELRSAGELDGKMRDSIAVTMKSAVAPWLRSTVVGRGTEIVFTPALLEHPAATLFVVAPATGVAAGAAVACIDTISKRWRANQTEKVKLPRLLMVVDELCNTMPWPKLPVVVTESRAMGIHLLVAVQATSQLAKRYGKEGMDELRQVFPATLLLVGAPEKEMLEQAAWWAGQAERQKVSVDSIGRQTQSSERADVITASDLLPRSIDEGRLLRGRRPGDDSPAVNEGGLLVTLLDISKMNFRSSQR
ncbi:TraM recognition domain-containing protein [Corynebacterium freneyi]|uniref:type IV secretory system conjugative DNA transfer family protein n=1 Tax=Corynebacterium freneyi TaxID=134034 RepID=UPI00254D1C0F|nr:TraM recognition domain-containing protein [Corynebacterium freneyi]MDK8768956.1 TraM recognition domain-containing protein [Corynebacterium freneyi]